MFGGFDFPYMINRINYLFPDQHIYKLLSPINNVYVKNFPDRMSVSIAGISLIDYMALYKWYSTNKLEKYSLERVAQEELGKGKLDFGNSKDLREMYNKDWNRYVDYNVIDTTIIRELEEKLGYINLVQYLSLLCKCQLNGYNATTKLVEGLMLTRFRRNYKCAPKFLGGHEEKFDAAYVKTPVPDLYGWSFSIDIQSSYPFGIIALNMSPETLMGKILNFSHREIINFTKQKEFPPFKMKKNDEIIFIDNENLKLFNNTVRLKHVSIAPNGSVFFNLIKGAYSEMERDIFNKRKEIKQNIRRLKKLNDPSLKNQIQRLHTMQWALKIVINGAYGATAVPYSRYFCPDLAEAVPAVGKEALMAGERYIDDVMNNLNNYPNLMKIIHQVI